MKIAQLLEMSGTLRRGFYDRGYRPTADDNGLAHWYNNVVPALARTFDIPTTAFKSQNDHGFGFQQGLKSKMYSVERVNLRVHLRKKGLDAEMMQVLLPKALKAELSKQLVDVQVTPATYTPSTLDHAPGYGLPAFLELSFRTKYPQEWIDAGRRQMGLAV